MSDKDPAENWQLQSSGKTEDQWQLREAEQSVLDQLQLQPTDATGPEWQPVDYVRPATSSRRWILPSIVTVLLLAVVGYMLWVGLGSMLPAITEPQPAVTTPEAPPPDDAATPSSEAVAAATAESQQPAPAPVVEEPTPIPTEEPPTATPAPPPFVEQRYATMNSQYGVNVRAEPSTDALLLTLLENNSKVWVLGEQADWVEIVLADGDLSLTAPISATTGWAAAQFVNLTTELVDPALMIAVYQALGREPPIDVSAPTAEAPAVEVSPTAEITSEIQALTAITPTLTVSSTNGLNLRAEPSVDAPIVRLLENGATAPVLAVSDDGIWYQIRLDDGVVGWAFGEFVVITGDLSVLPLPIAPEAVAPQPAAAPPAAVSVPVTETGTVTQPAPAVPPVEGAVATVTRLLPVYATPDSTQQRVSVLLGGAAVQVAGRSADGAYIQVLLPTGEAAWAPLSGVELNVEPATLPVTDGS